MDRYSFYLFTSEGDASYDATTDETIVAACYYSAGTGCVRQLFLPTAFIIVSLCTAVVSLGFSDFWIHNKPIKIDSTPFSR